MVGTRHALKFICWKEEKPGVAAASESCASVLCLVDSITADAASGVLCVCLNGHVCFVLVYIMSLTHTLYPCLFP